jgi:hypothetical protein
VRPLENMLFRCDARQYRKALETLMRPGVRFESHDVSKGQRYYVTSKMDIHIVDEIVRARANLA